jgi:ribosome-associated toxin RatA of RatAB toxin-antitoxin module
MEKTCQTLMLSGLALLVLFSSAQAAEPQLPTAQPAAAQPQMRQEGTILTVEGILVSPLSRQATWALLTDYARFPEFVPGIHSNRVLEQRNTHKLIDQRGMITSSHFQMPYQGVVQVEERKRNGEPEGIKIVFLSGILKDVQGEWNIQSGKQLGLTYRLRMDMSKMPFPSPMAAAIAEQQVKTWIDAFSRELKRIKE